MALPSVSCSAKPTHDGARRGRRDDAGVAQHEGGDEERQDDDDGVLDDVGEARRRAIGEERVEEERHRGDDDRQRDQEVVERRDGRRDRRRELGHAHGPGQRQGHDRRRRAAKRSLPRATRLRVANDKARAMTAVAAAVTRITPACRPSGTSSMSARVTLTLTTPGFGPPLASTSGSSPRAPPEATVWPDFFSPPPRLLARPPRPKPFFLGFSSAGGGVLLRVLVGVVGLLGAAGAARRQARRARRDRRDLRLRHRLVADELLVARFERHRAGALLLLLRGELVEPLLHRRVRGEQAALLAGVLVAIGQPLQERAQPVRLVAGLGGEAEADADRTPAPRRARSPAARCW